MSRFGASYIAHALPSLFDLLGESATFDPDGAATAVTVIVDPAVTTTDYTDYGAHDEFSIEILVASADVSEPVKGDEDTLGDEWEVRAERWRVRDFEPQTDKGLYRIILERRERSYVTREGVRG